MVASREKRVGLGPTSFGLGNHWFCQGYLQEGRGNVNKTGNIGKIQNSCWKELRQADILEEVSLTGNSIKKVYYTQSNILWEKGAIWHRVMGRAAITAHWCSVMQTYIKHPIFYEQFIGEIYDVNVI